MCATTAPLTQSHSAKAQVTYCTGHDSLGIWSTLWIEGIHANLHEHTHTHTHTNIHIHTVKSFDRNGFVRKQLKLRANFSASAKIFGRVSTNVCVCVCVCVCRVSAVNTCLSAF